jgi:hypothetical protein
MVTRRFTVLAALAVGAVANLFVGGVTAHADDVLPGLTCDDLGGVITCNNTTDKDYTVLQNRVCPGGTWTTTTFSPDPAYSSGMYTTTSHTEEPSVEFARVFAAAHNTGWGHNGCDHFDATSITYSIEPPPPA